MNKKLSSKLNSYIDWLTKNYPKYKFNKINENSQKIIIYYEIKWIWTTKEFIYISFNKEWQILDCDLEDKSIVENFYRKKATKKTKDNIKKYLEWLKVNKPEFIIDNINYNIWEISIHRPFRAIFKETETVKIYFNEEWEINSTNHYKKMLIDNYKYQNIQIEEYNWVDIEWGEIIFWILKFLFTMIIFIFFFFSIWPLWSIFIILVLILVKKN